MSSLLAYASAWNSDNANTTYSRKRTPTMSVPTPAATNSARKTVKLRPNYGSMRDQPDDYSADENPSAIHRLRTTAPESIDDLIDKQTDKHTKINSILNKLTSFSNDERLGDFNPMPYPTQINMKNPDNIIPADQVPKMPESPLLPKTMMSISSSSPPANGVYYRPSDGASSYGSAAANYREAYGREGMISLGGSSSTKEPYYSKMGIGAKGGSGDKLLDKLNYMTQMLESMQMEKTNHVTEEFVLYSLLGVFMIYIVDAFSRGGKYVR